MAGGPLHFKYPMGNTDKIQYYSIIYTPPIRLGQCGLGIVIRQRVGIKNNRVDIKLLYLI